jgi:hypothetical protein
MPTKTRRMFHDHCIEPGVDMKEYCTQTDSAWSRVDAQLKAADEAAKSLGPLKVWLLVSNACNPEQVWHSIWQSKEVLRKYDLAQIALIEQIDEEALS